MMDMSVETATSQGLANKAGGSGVGSSRLRPRCGSAARQVRGQGAHDGHIYRGRHEQEGEELSSGVRGSRPRPSDGSVARQARR